MCLPHTRGDEPKMEDAVYQEIPVCPTRVGMNRGLNPSGRYHHHVCPTRVGMNRHQPGCSDRRGTSAPHAWG